MSYDDIPDAHIYGWLTDRGVLDAVKNQVEVNSENGFDFWINAYSDGWPLVFDLDPTPVREQNGNIRSVQLIIGRPRSVHITNRSPEEEKWREPSIETWLRPEITTQFGDAVRLDKCPGLDGLLEMEARAARETGDIRDVLQVELGYLEEQWKAWVESDGLEHVDAVLRHLDSARREAKKTSASVEAWGPVHRLFMELSGLKAKALAKPGDLDTLGNLMESLSNIYYSIGEAEEAVVAERRKSQDQMEAAVWALQNGSSRLKKAVRAQLLPSSMGVYRDERLAAERPGWEWWNQKESPPKGIVNPSEHDLDSLLEARKFDPEMQLDFVAEMGPVIVGKYLNRNIIRPTTSFEQQPF